MSTTERKGIVLKLEWQALAELREALRVQIERVDPDVHTQWRRLERSWDFVEDEVKRVTAADDDSPDEVWQAIQDMVDELGAGYHHVRAQIQAMSRSRHH